METEGRFSSKHALSPLQILNADLCSADEFDSLHSIPDSDIDQSSRSEVRVTHLQRQGLPRVAIKGRALGFLVSLLVLLTTFGAFIMAHEPVVETRHHVAAQAPGSAAVDSSPLFFEADYSSELPDVFNSVTGTAKECPAPIRELELC